MDLPEPTPVTREEFSAVDFSVETFLNNHTQYISLDDLKAEVRGWERRLHQELVEAVSDNYEEFMTCGPLIEGCSGQLDTIKLETMLFEKEVSDSRAKLDTKIARLKECLAERKRLETERAIILRQIELCDLIETLATIDARTPPKELEMAAKLFVAHATCTPHAHEPLDLKLLEERRPLLDRIKLAMNGCSEEQKLRLAHVFGLVYAL